MKLTLELNGRISEKDVQSCECLTLQQIYSHFQHREGLDALLVNCWGYYNNTDWIKIPDDRLLELLMKDDSLLSCILLRKKGADSPQTTPPGSVSFADDMSKLTINKCETFANQVCPFTLEPLSNFDGQCDIVSISDGQISIFAETASFIEFIRGQVSDGSTLFEIRMKAFDHHNMSIVIHLTKPIWLKYLLRGQAASDALLDLFLTMMGNHLDYEQKLKLLHTDSVLWPRIKIFINDLMKFGNNEQAQQRLEIAQSQSEEYMFAEPYFNKEQAQRLLSFPTPRGLSVRELLRVLMKKKITSAGSTSDFGLCTSHDLAPVLQTVFGVRKGFDKEKIFQIAQKEFIKKWTDSSWLL
jgi:hypothetical protein